MSENQFEVSFPEKAENPNYSVIVSMWRGKWIYVRHCERDTWEVPGGRIEAGETPYEAASRELREETGALDLKLWEVGAYRVTRGGIDSDGVLFFASVNELGNISDSEIAELRLLEFLPDSIEIQLTYPGIQMVLAARVQSWLEKRVCSVTFIRHAESDISVRDGQTRPLTEKGLADAAALPDMLAELHLDAVYSSPYKRAADTVTPLARRRGLDVLTVQGFHEQITGGWKDDIDGFIKTNWADFDHKAEGGESLREVQKRNVDALNKLLNECKGMSLAIGTHGTALCAILNYYMPEISFEYFQRIRHIMPYIVRVEFLDGICLGMDEIPV